MARKRLSVLYAATECTPFAKVGGLADVVGSLPQALHRIGVTTTVVLPKYAAIPPLFTMRKVKGPIKLDYGRHKYVVSLYRATLPRNPVNYYFIDHPYFRTREIYGSRRSRGIRLHRSQTISDVDRFALFSEAVVEIVNQLHLPIDIIHCHDWETSLIPTSVDQLAVTKSYRFIKTVFTIHNIAYQGIMPRSILQRLDLRAGATPYLLEDYVDLDAYKINFMKLGILAADKITTVSPRYAEELLTSDVGSGLESFLRRRQRDFSGILNGIDTAHFNPATDTALYRIYSRNNWKTGKAYNKNRLQKEVGLPVSTAPLYSIVSRLVEQKGIDILLQALRQFIRKNVHCIILGTGEARYEQAFKRLAHQHPQKVSAIMGFDVSRAQKIYAGSDFFLMPSRFEPCGLGQMIAMRYGTVPIVRATGGLKDTVQHLKTGLVFRTYSPRALNRVLVESIELYMKKPTWYTMVEQCMQQDFSWRASAKKYKSLYQKLA